MTCNKLQSLCSTLNTLSNVSHSSGSSTERFWPDRSFDNTSALPVRYYSGPGNEASSSAFCLLPMNSKRELRSDLYQHDNTQQSRLIGKTLNRCRPPITQLSSTTQTANCNLQLAIQLKLTLLLELSYILATMDLLPTSELIVSDYTFWLLVTRYELGPEKGSPSKLCSRHEWSPEVGCYRSNVNDKQT